MIFASVPGKEENRLEEWIAAYGGAVLKLCFVYLGDVALAQDATQDTFVKVWRNMPSFKGQREESAKAWILRIAVNTCKDYRRAVWFKHVDRSKAVEDLPETVSPVSEDARALFLDVMNLPAKYKQAILLHHFQNLDQVEVGKILGISRTAVSKRLKRAYALLKELPEGRDDQ